MYHVIAEVKFDYTLNHDLLKRWPKLCEAAHMYISTMYCSQCVLAYLPSPLSLLDVGLDSDTLLWQNQDAIMASEE